MSGVDGTQEQVAQRALRRLELLWGAGQVRRYHTLPVLRQQSVGEHTYGVLVFLNLLTDFKVPEALARAAVLHDAPEVVMGDIPAPAKRLMRANGASMESAEEAVLQDYGLDVSPPLPRAQRRLLKLADCLEGMRFCAQEVATGNTAMRPVMGRFADYIEELDPLSPLEQALVVGVLAKAKAGQP